MSIISTYSLKSLAVGNSHVGVQAFWITTFALLTAVGAQIEIPRYPVPFTLQTFFVVLAGGILGKRNGFLSMGLYLLLGLLGFPVFSSASAGIAKILGPTGGYLLAFPLAAFLVGWMLSIRRSDGWILLSLGLGLSMIFVLGTIQLKMVTGMVWDEAIAGGFLIFSWWDLLKLAAAGAVIRSLRRDPQPK